MQVLLNVPDRYLLGITAEELAEQFKLSTALLMFQAGRLSVGAACEFADVDRYTFIAACKRHRIDVIDYDDEELATDFEQLKNNRSHAHHR